MKVVGLLLGMTTKRRCLEDLRRMRDAREVVVLKAQSWLTGTHKAVELVSSIGSAGLTTLGSLLLSFSLSYVLS